MKDYEDRFKAAERRYIDETRKSELNQNKMKELLAELDEERRLSQLDIQDKKELIRKIDTKNQQLASQLKDEKDDFKQKQEEFFKRNK